MRTLLLTFLIFFQLKMVFGQDAYTDSLLQELDKVEKESEKVDLLNQIAAHLVWILPDSSISYGKKAQLKALSINDLEGQSRALWSISSSYYITGYTDLALEKGQASIEIAKESGNINLITGSANNLGLIYQDLEKYQESIDYFKEAIDYARQGTENPHSIINNMANSFYYLEDYDKSMQYHEEALKIRQKDKNYSGIADCLNDIGLVHWKQGDDDLAIQKIKRCIFIKDSIGDMEGIAFSSLDLASIYDEKGDYSNVKNYAQKGLDASIVIGSKRYKQFAYDLLSRAEYHLGNYKKAYELHLNYTTIKDSILNEESIKNTSMLEAKYENQKKLAEIERLEKEKEIEKQENAKNSALIERDKIVKIALFSGLGLLVLLAFVLLKGLRQKKRDNEVISSQNLELESQKKEIKKQHEQLEIHFQEIRDSITYAERIQKAILPPLDYFYKMIPDSFVLYKPKDIVAGDFYWLETVGDRIIFAAADCTGHGVPGAMVSVVCHNALNRAVREFNCTSPAAILDKTRNLVIETFEKSNENVKDGMDIAICALEKGSNKLEFAGANNRLYLIRNNEITDVKGDKQPIGQYADPEPFTNHELHIEENDHIYIFSDGYPDQFGGPDNKKLKYKAFKQILLNHIHQPMNEQLTSLDEAFENWRGKFEQVDDVCVIGLKL
ncbi:MAG: tetratricopeptide repeat protein [Flavobacteriales bacterium]|nr:tetratricopeptide repeat protein [Flavobacteriales bacterium]